MRKSESGFALLFVYAMAATIAIMLYLELPRVAFEAQRDKEQLLIDRGEQYSRAIALFVRKFNRYPPDFDALDNTQNLRFLRSHYCLTHIYMTSYVYTSERLNPSWRGISFKFEIEVTDSSIFQSSRRNVLLFSSTQTCHETRALSCSRSLGRFACLAASAWCHEYWG